MSPHKWLDKLLNIRMFFKQILKWVLCFTFLKPHEWTPNTFTIFSKCRVRLIGAICSFLIEHIFQFHFVCINVCQTAKHSKRINDPHVYNGTLRWKHMHVAYSNCHCFVGRFSFQFTFEVMWTLGFGQT